MIAGTKKNVLHKRTQEMKRMTIQQISMDPLKNSKIRSGAHTIKQKKGIIVEYSLTIKINQSVLQFINRFLDEEKDSNNESDFHLPGLKEDKYFLSVPNDKRINRVYSVQYNGEDSRIIDQRSASILKPTKFEEQVSQYIPHRSKQKSVEKQDSIQEYYNDDEPQPISTKKPKHRAVSFHDNNQFLFQQRASPKPERQSISQKVSPLMSKNSLQQTEPFEQNHSAIYMNRNQLRVSQLKEKQIERTSKNIQELIVNRSQDNNNRMETNKFENLSNSSEQEETIQDNQLNHNKRNSSMLKEIEQNIYNKAQKRVTPFEEFDRDFQDETPPLINRRQKYISNNPIIEMTAPDSVKTSQSTNAALKNYALRNSINQEQYQLNNYNIQELNRNSKNSNLIMDNTSRQGVEKFYKNYHHIEENYSFQDNKRHSKNYNLTEENYPRSDKKKNSKISNSMEENNILEGMNHRQVKYGQFQNKQIPEIKIQKQRDSITTYSITPQKYKYTQSSNQVDTLAVKKHQFYNQPQLKELSPLQKYLQDEKTIQADKHTTPIKKYDRKSNHSPHQQYPISDYQLIKKLEHSSPILKQLKMLDKSFEEEQKENKELMNKINEAYMREREETEMVNKVTKVSKPLHKSPLSGLQKPQRGIHHSNFSNVNRSFNRKSSKEALQFDIPLKEQKELESILIQLKQYSKIIKKQKNSQKTISNEE